MIELKIYNNYDEFLADENRSNGCTQKWLDINEITLEDAQKLNWHNKNCFNCINCYSCIDCAECSNCYECNNCSNCTDCKGCNILYGCINCVQTHNEKNICHCVENNKIA